MENTFAADKPVPIYTFIFNIVIVGAGLAAAWSRSDSVPGHAPYAYDDEVEETVVSVVVGVGGSGLLRRPRCMSRKMVKP
ncbi:hypothetical protein KDAU_47320 [Dictyobacter aurantiacus]|uniref:Uncharacterized protein n=1 Tax=Dictyobacter aurantiacus TaxID=1936993 RepID=A0A401ZKM8_9CHLR|nr:hypothetical protein KDAU_47320 [Dictyobacter aurantiacus]